MAREKRVEISDEVADVLRRGEWAGWLYRLPAGQLDRRLYEAVDKVLRALGGKWNRGQRGHMFSLDAKAAMVAALDQGHVVDVKGSLEQFWTPDDLAERMVQLVGLAAGQHVLEPNAGNGRIVRAALAAGAWVTAVEISNDLAFDLPALDQLGALRVVNQDFLAWQPPADLDPIDVVLMNPPFSQCQDIRHVIHALDLLRHGGVLAAIMSPHFTFATDSTSRAFRKLIGFPDEFRMPEHTPPHNFAGSVVVAEARVELLPAGTFKLEGTGVNAVLVLIEKGPDLTGFGEDHRLGSRSWAKGRHGSIPTTEGAEGRNWVD
jgi:predicted RNA methylase